MRGEGTLLKAAPLDPLCSVSPLHLSCAFSRREIIKGSALRPGRHFVLKALPLEALCGVSPPPHSSTFSGRKKWITSTSQIKDLESQLKKRLLSLRRR